MGQWNAYESWLGLSLGGRAPTHYELLGLPPGAPQPAALRQAVLQRMAKVRPYQTGQHGEAATRLLNELAEAAVVLGDPRRRAAYDASLAGQKLTQEQASALEGGDWWESGGSLIDPFLEQLVGEMQQQTSPLLIQPKARRPVWYWPAIGGAGVAAVLLLTLVITSLGGGDEVGGQLGPGPRPPSPPMPDPAPPDPPPDLQRPPLLAYPATPAECQTAQQQWAEFLEMPVQLRSGVAGLELALIPAGQFWMGSPEWEAGRNADVETLAATTLTRPFYLGATEVTRAQWRTVMDFEPKEWREPGTTSRWPVTYVSWPNAEKFCQLLTQREHEMGLLRADWSYALPTEAQWEFACRAGSVGSYCCGENVELLKNFAVFAGSWRSGVQEVGQLQSNAYGLFDMHGNDQEWCRDWHTQRLPGGVDPYQAASGRKVGRSVRGGVAGGGPPAERAAHRNWSWYPPEYGDLWTGFRVALVPDATAIPGAPPATIPELPPLTRQQTADESRTCAALADDPAHSRWLIRPGELGGAEWDYEMIHYTAGEQSRTGVGPTPFLQGEISGVPLGTVWPTHRLRATIRIQMPPLAGQRIVLRVIYDSDLRIFANDRQVRSFPNQQLKYSDVDLTDDEQAAFHPGENEVVIECVGDGRPDWIDVFDLGLRLVPEPGVANEPPATVSVTAPPAGAARPSPAPALPPPADPLADADWIIPPGRYGFSRWQGVMTNREFARKWFKNDIPSAEPFSGPFGTPASPVSGVELRTGWTTRHLYLHTTFQLPSLLGKRVSLYVIHDDDAWLYVNSEPLRIPYRDTYYLWGYSGAYEELTLSRELTAQFQEGRNELHVHVVGNRAPNVFDLGLRLVPAAD